MTTPYRPWRPQRHYFTRGLQSIITTISWMSTCLPSLNRNVVQTMSVHPISSSLPLVEIPRTPHRIAAMVMGVESRRFILVENLDVAGCSPECTHDASTRESIAKNRSRGDNADFQTAMSKFQDPMTDSGTYLHTPKKVSISLTSPRHEVTTHNIVAEWTCICSAFFLTQSGLNTHQKSCQKWQCRESSVEAVDDTERQLSGPVRRWIRGHSNRTANDNQSKERDSRNNESQP